jgi:predicted dehydrogenase
MKKIKIGIFGVGRGMDLAKNFMLLGADIVAICDFNKERLNKAVKKVTDDTAIYDNFDSFIEHDLDAVVLANYFHEHTPFAIKCFEKGIHVFSECISNGTMAEGIELLKAFEKSNSIYMLAENYPQMIFNREMKRVCSGGTLGKILYAEGEYNHPGDPTDITFKKTYNYFPEHWRNFLPRSYYITHSLGPVMWATGATPKKVTSFASFAPIEGDVPTANFGGDRVSIVTTQNDDGSIFRITGCAAFGGHHNAYRICGTEGQIENLRGMGNKVMLRYNGWSKPKDMDEVNLYEPKWNDPDEQLIMTSGHGGGDYLTCRMFLDCIKNGKQPEHPFDVYSAINMSSVAILAHRSMLEGGKPYDIPDFTKEEDCKLYENDRLSPFYYTDGRKPTQPCCSQTDFKPTEKQIENYKKVLEIEY